MDMGVIGVLIFLKRLYMKKSELKIGMRVEDSWYPDAGRGIVKEILKTRVKIKFPNIPKSHFLLLCAKNNLLTYDNAHCIFLRKCVNRKIKK